MMKKTLLALALLLLAIQPLRPAIGFDAVDDALNYGDVNAVDGLTTMTVSLWAYRTSAAGSYAAIINDLALTSQLGWSIQRDAATSDLLLSARNGSNTAYSSASAGVIPLDTWVHIYFVYDGSQGTIANRGKLWTQGISRTLTQLNTTWPTSIGANTSSLVIGKHPTDTASGFRVAEVGIWTEANTDATRISNLAADYSPIEYPTNLVFYADLLVDGRDGIGNITPTVTGTTVEAHPKLYTNARRRMQLLTTRMRHD